MNDSIEGAIRGAIGSMAMSGMRAFTVAAGLVQETPPNQVYRRRAKGVLRLAPRKKRRAVIELCHWGFGAAGGAVYGALPDGIRNKPWSGPVYGMLMWTGFELTAPMLGLPHGKAPRLTERAATAVDHALYGLVLSDTKRIPTY